MNPEKVIKRFFRQLSDEDRAWLAVCCSFQIDDHVEPIRNGDEATAWLERYFAGARHPDHRFGRIIHLIAIIDFQLSPYALSRFAARAEQMTRSESEWLVSEGRRMLDERVSQLRKMVEAWTDIRDHELDEAALWVYRDEMQRLGVEEAGKQLRSLRWEP